MAYITEIYGWNNPGWTEDSPVRKSIGASLSTSTADFHITTDLKPSTDRLFTEFKLNSGNYASMRYLTFLKVTFDMTSGSNFTVYGYVDEVSIISDTSSLPSISVKWHVDPWETFKGNMSLGYAHVLRAASGYHPLQGYSSVRRYISDTRSLFTTETFMGKDVWWVVIAHTVNVNTYTVMQFITYPIADTDVYTIYGALTSSGTPKEFPSACDTAAGFWDEYLGISPNAITGAWISPIPPFGISNLNGGGAQNNPYYVDDPMNTWYFDDTAAKAYFRMMKNIGVYSEKLPSESGSITSLTTTERHPAVVCGFDGEPLQEFPVGVTLKNFTYRMTLDALECSISVRFNGIASRADGLNVTIPCLSLDLTENAWSEYNYSGQREYDIDSRNIASAQSMVEKTISGATQGFIMGGFNPAGAGLSAAAGAVGGVVQGGLDLAVFNPMQQNAIDKQRSKQTAGILLSGGAFDAIAHGEVPKLKVYSFDSISEAMALSSDTYHGYAVDLFVSNLGSYISSSTTGFWQAEGVNIGGSVPADAKRYIAELLRRGVYLIT